MGKSDKYVVVSAYDSESFRIDVVNHIGKGWELQGGVCVCLASSFTMYSQAMIYRVDDVGEWFIEQPNPEEERYFVCRTVYSDPQRHEYLLPDGTTVTDEEEEEHPEVDFYGEPEGEARIQKWREQNKE